jgi:hypothetical protein
MRCVYCDRLTTMTVKEYGIGDPFACCKECKDKKNSKRMVLFVSCIWKDRKEK